MEDDYSNNPQFNGGVAYVESIRALINQYHGYTIGKNYDTAYSILKQIMFEVYPRMNKAQREIVTKHNIRCMNSVQANVKGKTEMNKGVSIQLDEFFRDLNVIMHELKLIMPNKLSQSEALD